MGNTLGSALGDNAGDAFCVVLGDAVGDAFCVALCDFVGARLGAARVGPRFKTRVGLRVGLLEREGRRFIVAAGGKTELLDGAIEGLLPLGLAIGLHEG